MALAPETADIYARHPDAQEGFRLRFGIEARQAAQSVDWYQCLQTI